MKIRLVSAHIVEFIHAYLFRHHPRWTCHHVMNLWPEEEHDCAFCRKFWPNPDIFIIEPKNEKRS